MVSPSPRNLLIATVLVSAIVGSVTGLGVGYLARTRPAIQTRDIYLFARDLSLNTSLTSGLTSDYIYSSTVMVVNKGDTLAVHFYNPTDASHTFTTDAPYARDAVVAGQPTDKSPIHNATITLTTNQAGIFAFHCRFHQPQMSGTIVVQG